jgi:hypothetical protein
MTRGDATVTREEVCRGRQGPELVEIERASPDEALDRNVHLLVRPLEGNGADIERVQQGVDDLRGFVRAVRLADEEKP